MRFQSTLPSRGATTYTFDSLCYAKISIHAPLAGSDKGAEKIKQQKEKFQSTLPSRGATYTALQDIPYPTLFQSTLPSRGATHIGNRILRYDVISIHAPLAGSDVYQQICLSARIYFNPRSPRGERLDVMIEAAVKQIFQSTLPSRGATTGSAGGTAQIHYFNPRSPRGERQYVPRIRLQFAEFQSTLPSRGATRSFSKKLKTSSFQSTLPSRGATPVFCSERRRHAISIHAPLAGSDQGEMD